jgi:L-threonylcarbamoyladenylate synthase
MQLREHVYRQESRLQVAAVARFEVGSLVGVVSKSFETSSLSIAPTTDASIIASLIHDAWRGTVDPRSSGHRFTVADAEALLEDPNTTVLLAVDESDGKAAGSVVLVHDGKATVELMKLAVPERRTHGVGSALLDAAQAWATAQKVTKIVLAVSVYQPHLVRYYARRGYVVAFDEVYTHANPASPRPIVMINHLPPPSDLVDPIAQAVEALRQSQLVVLPTETVYGLGALASDPVAVRRLFATKGRPVDHPLIVHVANGAAIDTWAYDIPDAARTLAAMFWPGPLTMVLKKRPEVLPEVTGGLGTVALRVPNHPVALAVLGMLPPGSGVAAPSANRFGKVSPTTADAASDLRPYMLDGDLILNGGPCAVGVESTIVDLTTEPPTILRPGGISAEQLDDALGVTVERIAAGPSRAPGMLAAHYAPRAGVRLTPIDGAAELARLLVVDGQRVGLLAPSDVPTPTGVTRLDGPTEYSGESLAPILYARLRDADDLELDVLVVVTPIETGLGWAVADRLRRAAHGSAAAVARSSSTS